MGIHGTTRKYHRSFLFENIDLAIELARLAHEMAIPIAAGTDRDNSAEELFEELEMLVDSVGLTPTEALSAATHIGATVLGLQEMLGSVEVGRVADLVVYESDPTQDIRNARRPSVPCR